MSTATAELEAPTETATLDQEEQHAEAEQAPAAGVPVDVAIPAPPPPNAEERLTALEEMEREVAAAEAEWRDCKEATKEAKAVYDAKVLQMRAMIRAASNDKNRPLLAAIEKPAEPDADPAIEAWRAATLEAMGINGRIAKALGEANLTTRGLIADYQQQYNLRGIPGLGDKSQEELQELLENWDVAHPVASAGPEEEEDDDSDLDDEDDD